MPAGISVGQLFGACLGLWLGCGQLPAEDFFPPRPADVAMNPEAGRGGLLLVKLRLADGEVLPLILDTGSPGMLLDKSLIPKLGKKLDTMPVHSFDTHQDAGVYAAPKVYLGDVQLVTGNKVVVVDLPKLSPYLKPPIKGILGMDCLQHYCLQLDFQSGTIHFLDPARLDTTRLGNRYHLTFISKPEHGGVPVIWHAGLLGGSATNTVLDIGNNSDGMAPGRAIRQNARGSYSGGLIKRSKHFLAVEGWVNHPVGSLKCDWDGNTYTNIAVGRGPRDYPNWIGLRFLARHLVTFDFPNATMYLKQTSSGPLPEPVNTNSAAATQKP
ncbi:MAG TPA: retropepsin-like aspartic protease [Verrucomicrobiae bacterium]|nr:retropepsin-like aspartic protease [Verrucomicrobiae bacterium]